MTAEQVPGDAGTTPSAPTPAKPTGRLCANGWISTYLEYTKNQASPALFHVWTAISIMAGAMRRNVYINRGGYYTLYPNLYVVLVAPTGKCMKSTAAGIGIRLLKKVENIRIIHEKITPEGLISYLAGEMSTNGKKGIYSKVIKNAQSVELREECNCFVFAPELSVFLGGVSYTAGLIELLTSLYEGKDKWEYSTKTHGQTNLTNVNINLFGASNPEWLAKGFSEDAFGGGFMGRTIYIFQNEGKKVAWPTKPAGMDELEMRLTNDLFRISELRGEYAVTDEARDYYTRWYEEYKGDFTGRMSGYYERKPDHILKLAMIISASHADVKEITPQHIKAAIKMLEEVESLMPKAFAYIGATNEARVSQHIIEIIAGSPKQFISYRRLLASIRHMIKHRREFEDIMDTLVTSGSVKTHTSNNVRYYALDDEIFNVLVKVEAVAEAAAKQELEDKKKEDIKSVLEVPKEAPATTLRDVMTAALEKLQ